MLNELTIKNFAIIDDLRVSFKEGLSILSGETGAGKSMIIQAVNLLLGARASADMVRSGCSQAELEAFFDISPGSNSARVMAEQDLDTSEGLIIRRVMTSAGKSRVYINSRQTTLELLKQVTQDLAGISSQHAHQGLLKEEHHLDILDDFAQTQTLRSTVNSTYSKMLPIQKEICLLKNRADTLEKEYELYRFQRDEIEAADIRPEEDAHLEKKRDQLQNSAQVFELVNRAIHDIHDREGAMVENLALLVNECQRFASSDDRLEPVSERLSAILYDLQDAVEDLRHFSSDIDLDPASLDAIEQRLDTLAKLKRKYGGTLETVLDEYQRLSEHLDQAGGAEEKITLLEKTFEQLHAQLSRDTRDLSEKRQKAAATLCGLVQDELKSLEMGQTTFDVAFSFDPASGESDIASPQGHKIGPSGMDNVCFLISPNPGESLKPLAKIASGGELSRIVLALKAVLSKTNALETLIFDEVDAGIGGATSERVGQKLKQLATTHQVICITHLAQIAKFGNSQYRILKTVDNNRTFTTITPLTDEAERVAELARMIGGEEVTSATLAHARELLKQSQA